MARHSLSDWMRAALKKGCLLLLSLSLGCGPDATVFRSMEMEPGNQRSLTSAEKNTPVTLEQVRAALDPDEPNYASAGQLGGGALPHLHTVRAGACPFQCQLPSSCALHFLVYIYMK